MRSVWSEGVWREKGFLKSKVGGNETAIRPSTIKLVSSRPLPASPTLSVRILSILPVEKPLFLFTVKGGEGF